MRRREFIALVGGAASWPLIARAQPKVVRVGFLFYGMPGNPPEVEAFRKGLREHGWIEGQNIQIEYRFASGQVSRLPDLAAELVNLKVDAIVTPGTPASIAAKRATASIPIIFAGVADAVGAGLVPDLARPAGNVTGLTSISAHIGGKRLELLKELVPSASRIAVLHNPGDVANVLVVRELREAAPALGLTLLSLEVRSVNDFADAFETLSKDGADALFGAAGVLTFAYSKEVVELTAKSRLPAMWGHRQFVDVGGLMSYAVNFHEQVKRASHYVDRILKGAQPRDLPVEQPSTFEFIINLETSKTLKLDIPPKLLARADEVIE